MTTRKKLEDNAADPILDPLRRRMTIKLLKYAVGRAICCPTCGKVLDYRRAVMISAPHYEAIACASCYDAIDPKVRAEFASLPGREVIDGREVSK